MRLIEHLVLLSLVTYRVTRFGLEDSLIERQREWLLTRIIGKKMTVPEWRMKIYHGFKCPYCVSVWVAAGAVALTDWRTSVDLPVWVWLGASSGAVIVWAYTET